MPPLSAGTSERNPAWRRISWISSSENSASWRKSTLTAGMRLSGEASSLPTALTSPPSLIWNFAFASVRKRIAAAICISTRGLLFASVLIQRLANRTCWISSVLMPSSISAVASSPTVRMVCVMSANHVHGSRFERAVLDRDPPNTLSTALVMSHSSVLMGNSPL